MSKYRIVEALNAHGETVYIIQRRAVGAVIPSAFGGQKIRHKWVREEMPIAGLRSHRHGEYESLEKAKGRLVEIIGPKICRVVYEIDLEAEQGDG